jgi:hypothetical protein
MARKKARKAHLVVRRGCNAEGNVLSTERVPIAACARRADAERLCRELEDQLHREFDPWRLFGSDLYEILDRFVPELRRVGLPEPEERDYEWTRYAAAVSPTSEQRRARWDAVPELRFYEVVETTLQD